jgi:NADH:ubiquinone oxidoreductase subunit K
MKIDASFVIFAVLVLTFVAGVYCLLVSRNLLRILIGLEILIKGITLFIIYAGHVIGQTTISESLVITLIIIEVIVMVVACGISIGIYKHNNSLKTDKLNNLKG